jgi:non-specific serine/threonine protein kinase
LRTDVFVVVIGRRWLTADHGGKRRLDDPTDYVAREITRALELDIRIIPVLVDGAVMPAEGDLPASVRPLARRNAVIVSDVGFDHDMGLLLSALARDDADIESAFAPRSNLPRPSSSFVGRDRELTEISALCRSARLVTLIGAGGCGKTRLAVQYARGALHMYPDGVWFVDLAVVEDPALVPGAVGAALGVDDAGSDEMLAYLVERLADRKVLFVLDNCEHLVDGVSPLLADLLKRTGTVKVLATSRQHLGVSGEHAYPVPPLESPGESITAAEETAGFAAARLFADRAAVAQSGFRITDQNAADIGGICRRLDGLPLALELAAARLNILSPDDLRRRLDDCFSILTGGPRDGLAHQRTLAATLAWSYQLLTPEEQDLFSRLSVFSGGFVVEAAEEVCGYGRIPRNAVLDLISSLVNQSLLVPYPGLVGQRIRFLETVRDYASSRLDESADREQTAARHAAHYRRLAVESYGAVWGPDEATQLDRLDEDWPNLRRALRWHLDTGHAQDGMLMGGSLRSFFWRRYHASEGLDLLRRLVEADTSPGPGRARALLALGTLDSDYYPMWDETVELNRHHASKADLAAATNNAGYQALVRGDWDKARERLAEALPLRRKVGDAAGLSITLGASAELALVADDDPVKALELMEEGMASAYRSGSPENYADMLRLLGVVRRFAGDLDGATEALEEAQRLQAGLGEKYAWIGWTEVALASVALARESKRQALAHLLAFNEVVQPLKEDGHQWTYQEKPLLQWAQLAILHNAFDTAVVLIAASEASHSEKRFLIEFHPSSAEVDAVVTTAKANMSPEAFDRARAKGLRMGPQEAVDYAVSVLAV